jgi:hypothetical protein
MVAATRQSSITEQILMLYPALSQTFGEIIFSFFELAEVHEGEAHEDINPTKAGGRE